MPTIKTPDNTELHYKDWGTGQPIVFSPGWPLRADGWDGQMLFFGQHGYRVIAHDRRGHGRSSQTWAGNERDSYSDDLATLLEKLDLKILKQATLQVYSGLPHGMPATNADLINADLLGFIKA